MNASPADVTGPMANLHLGRSKKKRPTRAYHSINSPQPTPPVPNGIDQPYANGYGSTLTELQPQGMPQIGNATGYPDPINGLTSLQGLGNAQPAHASVSVDISNPMQMAQQESVVELSLAAARYAKQKEFSTPLYAEDGSSAGYQSFLSFQNVVPPLAGTQYHAIDQGTAVPKFIRSTMYNVPESENLRRATKLPVAVTVRPFAPLLASEDPVPVVDMTTLGAYGATDESDVGPPRCNRCRAFINPCMKFTNTSCFTCNICQFSNNTVPQEYTSPIDMMTHERIDRLERPELHKGVYDIILPKYYNVGGKDSEPQGLHHVFLIDVCHQSITSKLPVLIADALRAAIFDYLKDTGDLQEEVALKFKFAIILFDQKMQFFNLSSKLDSAQLVISPDLEDPFVPFTEGLFVDPQECAAQIEDALNKLEGLCNSNVMNDSETCISVALRSAMLCLENVGGGKITAVLSTLSAWGPGRSELTAQRTVGRNPLAEMEKTMYSPSNKYYQLLAKDMIAQNVALDVFAVAKTPVDMANLGWLASITGGYAHKFADFRAERDGRTFTSKIYNSVHKTVGYQGLFKLRCSTGLNVSQYYGFPTSTDSGIVGYSNPGQLDPVVPVLTEDQTFTVLLEYEGVLKTNLDCHFQASVLYTDLHGVRKLRVINLVTSVGERLNDVFTFVDQETMAITILRESLSFVGKQLIADLRNSINEKVVDVFAHYRAMSEQNRHSSVSKSNEFLFPDSMKHFALFVLAIIKTKAMRDSTSISDDLRLCDLYEMMFMPMDRLVYHLCPALVEVHSLQEDDCMVLEDEANVDFFIKVPEYKPLSARTTESSVYILCNGTSVFVRIHPDSNLHLLKDLFGDHIESYQDIDRDLDCFPELSTRISQQVRNLVKFFHMNIIGSSLISDNAIIIARDGIDSTFHLYSECLIEDKLPSKTVNTSPNYVEFLGSVHKAVNVKLASDKNTKKDLETTHVNETLAQRYIHF